MQAKNITNEIFGKNLRWLMARCGASQEVIAEDLGIAQSAVSNYLRGRVPRADILMELATYFGVSGHDLLSGKLDENQKSVTESRGETEKKAAKEFGQSGFDSHILDRFDILEMMIETYGVNQLDAARKYFAELAKGDRQFGKISAEVANIIAAVELRRLKRGAGRKKPV